MEKSKYPPKTDLLLRWNKVQNLLKESGADACFVSTNVNMYYLTGRIFAGFVFLPQEGEPILFVQKPMNIEGDSVVYIRKPEDIPAILKEKGWGGFNRLLFEADQITYNEFIRFEKAFQPVSAGNTTPILRTARMTKTPWEIDQMRISYKHHADTYAMIPSVFVKGMRDFEFQYEIERLMRKNGSLGIFRTFGHNMEIFMGSLLTGKNAETPSPFDFALGGGGLSPCLPIGASGEVIQPKQAVMVDFAGNFTAYMTDMTRVYSYGTLPDIAYKAHEVSIKMHNHLMKIGKPGILCSEIYNYSLEMAEEAGLADYFMGTIQKAKFVGHGVGIEINEPAVLTPRSKDVLQPGMTIAYEPKFVLPDVGAVGIENTFLVKDNSLEKITVFEENIIDLLS